MNVQKLMKEAQRAQRKVAEAQERLATLEVEGGAGGGLVTATVTGEGALLKVAIDPGAIDPEDPTLLEDLIVAAVKDAQRQAKEVHEREMGSAMGGLGGMPGMF